MYDPAKVWSDEEDNALREFYQRHGTTWEGWAEVLPGRTIRAISARAVRLGIAEKRGPRQKKKTPKKKRWQDPMHKAMVKATADPYEGYVTNCMDMGMTPQEIDRKMNWGLGTARMIMSEKWLRDKESR